VCGYWRQYAVDERDRLRTKRRAENGSVSSPPSAEQSEPEHDAEEALAAEWPADRCHYSNRNSSLLKEVQDHDTLE